jgi:uncharacterized protein (TIGR03437 family)
MKSRPKTASLMFATLASLVPVPSLIAQSDAPTRARAFYTQIYADDLETVKAGLQLQGASVTTVPSQVIAGTRSLLIDNRNGFVSNPQALHLSGNTVYTVSFDYRILAPASVDYMFYGWFQPEGTNDPKLSVTIPSMLKNAPLNGTFSTGALTTNASSYVLKFYVSEGVRLLMDNIVIYRQDIASQTTTPESWSKLGTAPFPRLGKYILGNSGWNASTGSAEGKPFAYTVDQIESKLAFFDVIAGLTTENQTLDPASIYRLRSLNPNAVILPYRVADVENNITPRPDSAVDLDYQLLQSVPPEWRATDSTGHVLYQGNFPDLFYMNLSDFAPSINGQTWRTALPNFVTTKIFPSGLWDGVFFDLLNGAMEGNVPHYDDPALFDYDWNRNGVRDETRAATNEMIRAGNIKLLQQVNASADGMQLVMGNSAPEFGLAPLVNGYTFECLNLEWLDSSMPALNSPARWRQGLDGYLRMQAITRAPQTNVLEACGANSSDFNSPNASRSYLTPVPEDFQKHRFAMGTALLGDGFYGFDLYRNASAPFWFDEYSVDSFGTAVEDRAKKGYLGHALGSAAELAAPGVLVLQEGFESSSIPNTFVANPASGVSISRTSSDVISGTGSLVLRNSDHTRAGNVGVSTNLSKVPLKSGDTYLLSLDWRVLDTIDHVYGLLVTLNSATQSADHSRILGVIRGDTGTLHFPFTVPSSGSWTINVLLTGGGGAIAIDNIQLFQGGVGSWRRDFENGFVLVNPLPQSRTFSAAELSGALHRTGIRHIKGTQAPTINNGLLVAGDLTVGAFDSVILLADSIAVSTPAISSVSMAGGGQSIAPNGWIEIKGSNLAPPGVSAGGLLWSNEPAFQSGLMPTDLASVRVTVNGKPAFVYFVSPNQVNVLAPLDNTTGPVQIVVTSSGVSSAPYIVNRQNAVPSFPLIGSTRYVVATHADYSLIGPTELSLPGYAFTPARAGETIVLYAFGLGLPSEQLVNGSSVQSGSLPIQPRVQIGGADAKVVFAGLISPGLYQVNVVVPLGLPIGDNSLTLLYSGQSSVSNLINTQ